MLQAKKRFWGKRPGFDMGDVLHIGVNVLFVAVLYAMITLWDLLPLAIILVVLSKWRILAVQPRFWSPNIKANLVDLIVGMSSVGLAGQAASNSVAIAWMVLYLCWLLFVKPRSADVMVSAQAYWGQLIGLLALFMIPSLVRAPLFFCILAWLIAWSAARHFFTNYEEPHYRSLSLVWAFIAVQGVWFALHWVQYYSLLNMNISLFVVVFSILSASIGSMYHTYKKQSLKGGTLIENGLFAAALIVILLLTAEWTTPL
jgi:hypothetical protein